MLVERAGADVLIHPCTSVCATVDLPGSKSLTNRYLTCLALADGIGEIQRVTLADDVERMIAGLQALEIRIEVLAHDAESADKSVCEPVQDPRLSSGATAPGMEKQRVGHSCFPAHATGSRIQIPRARSAAVQVHGCGGFIPAIEAEIDVGHAGTTMRFLTALCCLGQGRYRLDGSQRMRARPIGQLVDGLRDLGGAIGYEDREGFPPLTLAARGLRGGSLHFAAPPSSQYVSALLMVASYAAHDVLIQIDGSPPSKPYIDMTIAAMRSLGVEVLTSVDAARYVILAGQRYQARTIQVEPDASAATYFWAAAAITGGSVRVRGLTRRSFQGDVAFVDVLARMGCRIFEDENALGVEGPPVGQLAGVDVDLNAMPDTAQTLAVAALFARGPTRIRNVANLRIKETDRLAALQNELQRLGARVELTSDGLSVDPPAQITPARIATYDDHRMAMSFALAGLRCEGVIIADADCVSKSFPDFFGVLASLA